MPVLRNLTIALVLVAAAAGCGSGGSTPPVAAAPTTTSSSSSASSGSSAAATSTAGATPAKKDDGGVGWAKCMRAHGVEVSDPSTQGKGVRLLMPKSADHTKSDAAMKACQKFLPDGGKLLKADPAQLAEERKMSVCMRQNGVPTFPDPEADGGIKLNGGGGLDPSDPTFIKAQSTCSKYAPQGPGGGAQVQAGK